MARLTYLCVLVVACHKEPTPPASAPVKPIAELPRVADLIWSTPSGDGRATLQLQRTGTDATLSCGVGNALLWVKAGVVGDSGDYRFVSNDCAVVALLYPMPKRHGTWSAAVLVRVLTHGVVSSELTAHQLGVDTSGAQLRWLVGALGEGGEAPHLTADGRLVEFEVKTLGGRATHHIPLVVDEAVNQADETLYSWVGPDGVPQFVQGLANVPARYRPGVRVVQGHVSTLPWDAPPPVPDAPAVTTPTSDSSPAALVRGLGDVVSKSKKPDAAELKPAPGAEPSGWGVNADGEVYVTPPSP